MKKTRLLHPSTLSWLFIFVLLSACEMPAATPTAGIGRGFTYTWYVATSGNDDNDCSDPGQPCATLEGAFQKARATNTRVDGEYTEPVTVFHTVNVAAGTYLVTTFNEGYPFARANINVSVVGASEASTVFDAGDTFGGIFVNGDVRVSLRELTIQNVAGYAPDSCVNIRGDAEVTIENVTIRRCVRSGIAHSSSGPLTLINVSSHENLVDPGGNGTGVSSFGDLTIEGGSFSNNEGSGIASSGSLEVSGTLVELNGRDGITLSGHATMDNVIVSQNGQDLSFRAGLVVAAGGDAVVRNSIIEENQYGVWLRGEGSQANLTDSMVANNPRTGIGVSDGELRLTRTVVQNNASFYAGTGLGGGLDIASGARAVLRESQIIGNLNGGVNNLGEFFLIESSITGNDGGLPALFNAAGATAILERSLIANNTRMGSVVTGDNAVENRGTMNTVNVTISGNNGNGITNSGALNLGFATVAFNENYGLLSSESGSTSAPWLASSIIAGNGTDCYVGGPFGAGPFTLSGPSIDSDGSCGFPETATLADLHLDALADNGGPTFTHALLTGSPAIDTSTGSCPPNDQRVRARPFGSACDMGAYETGSTIVRISDESVEFEPEIVTATPTPGEITAIITTDARCRTGPGFVYGDYDFFTANQTALVYARVQDSSWYQVQAPTLTGKCWIGQAVLQFDVNTDILLALPVLQPPATPTPTLDPDEGSDDGGQEEGGGGQGGSAPAAPSKLQADENVCNANKYEIELNWKDNSDNEAGFRIYHNGQQVATVGANSTQYFFSVPSNWGQQQTFQVEAYNNSGAAKSGSAIEDGCIY